MCGQTADTFSQIIRQYAKLARDECKVWHNKFGSIVHRELTRSMDLQVGERYYCHRPDKVVQNKTIKYYRIFQSLLFMKYVLEDQIWWL